MKILIGCEESQAVCIEFRKLGFEAYSCDIQECSGGHPEWHFNDDLFKVIAGGHLQLQNGETVFIDKWKMLIGHPPCTFISFAGIRWFNVNRYNEKAIERIEKMNSAMMFFLKLWNAPIEMICLENPRGFIGNFLKPSQTIQPYYFGDSTSKTTLLWLRGLPLLHHVKNSNLFEANTHVDKGAMCGSGSEALFGTHTLSLSKADRSKLRSKTFPGIARAMAEQWGEYLLNPKPSSSNPSQQVKKFQK